MVLLAPADRCYVAGSRTGTCCSHRLARGSTQIIPIRSGLSDQAINIRKNHARDDKKTSPAPKSGAAEKKEVAAKKDEAQPKDKTTPDADRSKAESGGKATSSPSDYSRARAKNRFRKHIGITGTRFTRKEKRRSGNWINGASIAVSQRA
jgi:hypothetical protein